MVPQPPNKVGFVLLYTQHSIMYSCVHSKMQLCPQRNILRILVYPMCSIRMSICEHMNTRHFLLCTQECIWNYFVHSTGFFTYKRVHNGILYTQEYKAHSTVEVMKAFLDILIAVRHLLITSFSFR